MKNHILILICCLFRTMTIFSHEEVQEAGLLLSTPEQVASLSCESSCLIGGVISPLSGQPILRETDLIARGAQNVVLSRIYIPPYISCFFPKPQKPHKHHHHEDSQLEEYDKKCLYSHLQDNYKGWQIFSHVRLQYFPNSGLIRIPDPNGFTLDFRVPNALNEMAVLSSPPYALHNTSEDVPSGKHDPRNTRVSFETHRIIVYAADGSIRFYNKQRYWNNIFEYLLEKEFLPNGKVLKYHYDNTGLDCIESLDPKERYTYASIRMERPNINALHFTSSTGMTADYVYQKRTDRITIQEKIKNHKTKHVYPVISPSLLTSVSSPFYRNESLDYCSRFLLGSYSGKDQIFTILNEGYEDRTRHYRVHKLSFPVGQNDVFEPVYTFNYQPAIAGHREGTTAVKNSDGTSIIYHFSKDLLTTRIQYFGQDGALKKEKQFFWNAKNWLHSLEMKDGNGHLLYRKTYEYDAFANPIIETFTGDLTGDGSEQTFTIKRLFSQEGRNLLLQEESEDGKVICFSYLSDSNLVTSKLTKEGDKILLRIFSTYDDCNNLLQTITDDGTAENKEDLSNVTERILTTYTLRPFAPFLHMPEWVQEFYWENGIEKPLKKRHFLYDPYGNVAQEEVYDAQSQLRYTICKTYNERGDILSETNALGQTAYYTYDAKGRLQTETNYSSSIYNSCSYDTNGRLRKQTESGNDGVVHAISYDYDANDRLIHKMDSFNNSMHYTYDPLVNEINQTDFPSIASLDGESIPVTTHSTYDSLGRELVKTDANGNTTAICYNAYGFPSEIIHPNGARETFRYAKNGQRISYTDSDGLTIFYKNDILGRVVSKMYISNDTFLAEERFTYNGFHLLSETDKEGYTKCYSYDGAGRKIREEFCGQITEFSYDELGWLSTICKHNGDNTLVIYYKRDLEGRILEERKTDISDRTLYRINYSYDNDGNRFTITRHINGKAAVQTYRYDSFKRLIEEIDANGYSTKTTFDENYVNALGQKVLQIKRSDALDVTHIEVKDALHRTVKNETLNAMGARIACREMTCDPQGNLLFQRDHIYKNGAFHQEACKVA